MTITANITIMGGTSDQDIMVGVLRNVKAIIFPPQLSDAFFGKQKNKPGRGVSTKTAQILPIHLHLPAKL